MNVHRHSFPVLRDSVCSILVVCVLRESQQTSESPSFSEPLPTSSLGLRVLECVPESIITHSTLGIPLSLSVRFSVELRLLEASEPPMESIERAYTSRRNYENVVAPDEQFCLLFLFKLIISQSKTRTMRCN